MISQKTPLYYTFSEQEARMKKAMKEVLIHYKHFEAAKKIGNLKVNQHQLGSRLFDV